MDAKRIGIVGTGFIARGLILALAEHADLKVSKVLTRRKLHECPNFPGQEKLTNDVDDLIEHSDLIVECSGDVIHGTEVIHKLLTASLPVVTMNAEFHVTTGSYFVNKGFVTEAEGDQPGCLAILKENAVSMGFKPLVYGNVKGFLNHTPEWNDMKYWAKKHGISLRMVTAFTDGTKIEIEQALVANGLNADIAEVGLLGIPSNDINTGALVLADKAKVNGYPISDYLLIPRSPASVFIVAEHHENQREALKYFKLGDGPYYTLTSSFHLCHLEIIKTIRRVFSGGGILLNNGVLPAVGVASIAKRTLNPGDKIEDGIGSFDVRGKACHIRNHIGHVPIGLLKNAVVKRRIAPGQLIHFDDIEIPESLALTAWIEIERSVRLQSRT
ncbi:NAD(P)-dependent oxidoreductase [Paenibacillus spongiae]|uniref:NAD(P)-dependent oxidoreductase n=1 Tax=Paenibacillus spongiae TaxID=2909671 RepID=A0ABY5S7W0_9BACL|nr:NAD(P)-dependent oxidoreductase [Paenibacillus spongiae]UVI28635.1 NAD(P)-dependent oxidoreductase [Paenibacillus spongiae]